MFFDENAKLIDDPDHSEDEDRFVLLGLSSFLRVILVCHCYRDEGATHPWLVQPALVATDGGHAAYILKR